MTKFWAALEAISAFLGVIRDFFSWKKSADDRQAGRDEVRAHVNKESADAQDRMAKVADNPSDDDVARRMQTGSF